MAYETLLVDTRDGVAWVTLNRPEVRNAFNRTMTTELQAALAALEGEPDARVVVLRGAGDQAFCSGADLQGFSRGTTLEARDYFAGFPALLAAMARLRRPIIARVHGYALAGGCGLAAGCDLVVAAEDAVFGLPEITIGMPPAVVVAPILRAVGFRRAMRLILTGERISGREAYEWGLASHVVPRARLDETVADLAQRLAAYSPSALGLAKEAVTTARDLDYDRALRYLREIIALVALSDDAREGIAAFREKRPPRWTGR